MLLKTVILNTILSLFLFLPVIKAQNNFYFYYNYTQFDFPGRAPFTEFYIGIPAKNLVFFRPDQNINQAYVDVKVSIYQNDSLYYHERYNLLSQVLEDTGNLDFFIIDLHRVMLQEGKYLIEIYAEDKNSKNNFKLTDTFSLKATNDQMPAISEIQLADTVYPTISDQNRFSKYGFDIIPNVTGHLADFKNAFYFYLEIYHTQKHLGDELFLETYIVDADSQIISGKKLLKRKTSEIVPVIGIMDISGFETGYYTLKVDLINNEKEIIDDRSYLFAIGKGMEKSLNKNSDTIYAFTDTFSFDINYVDLQTYVNYLIPIAKQSELSQIHIITKEQSEKDSMDAKLFFFSFWQKRNKADPHNEWNTYLKHVNIVNYHFTSQVSAGYLSDRGYVFLKYGPPNEIIPHIDEPEAYPYEIWRYNHLDGISNVIFVFYNPTQLQNEFELLHSNMRGEIMNKRWKNFIYSRSRQIFDSDRNSSPNNHGSQLDRLSSP